MSDIAKSVGQRIRNYRNQLDISQEKLAEFPGCLRRILFRLSVAKNATLESIEKISSALTFHFQSFSKKSMLSLSQIYHILIEMDKYKES